jgi:inosine-uridine nucleoside N-ribohydrolase
MITLQHLRNLQKLLNGACMFSCLVAFMALCSCSDSADATKGNNDSDKPYHVEGTPNVIVDTDLGNCTDDALAMQVLFKYRAEGKLNLLAVMGNSKVPQAKRLLDSFMHYYKADDVPLGIIDGEGSVYEMIPYYHLVDSLYADGTPWFPATGIPLTDRLPAWKEYRKQLSQAADNSVSIICIGALTNLGLLMESGADEYSSLSGMELIKQKVQQLNVTAGCFTKVKLRFDNGYLETEYNIAADIPLAKKVLEEWPTNLSILPLEEGMKYPSDHDEVLSDYAWTPQSPMYLIYSNFNEWERGDVGQYWWDPVCIMHCAEPKKYFDCTAQGELSVSDKGITSFQTKTGGKAHVISSNAVQAQMLYQALRSAAAWQP